MSAEARAAPIRTPDQRLRVFVSSTLKELEPERRAARAAIERLRLAPVMFELGARPHPPRQLYRAYLEQSDVFVGVYWQEYGWIAPGEEISGLEDEYRLAPREMPKLIYVKQPAEREERLGELMARIRDDDTRVVHAVLHRRGAGRARRGRPRDPARRAVRRLARRTGAARSRRCPRDASRRPTPTPSAASATSRRCSSGSARTRSGSSRSWARAGSARAASRSRSPATRAHASTG